MFDREGEEALHTFFAWLPRELHAAPGIDWSLLPAGVMRYCIRNIDAASPDATFLAMAVASAHTQVSDDSQLQMLRHLHTFFSTLRTLCQLEHVSDLRGEAHWNEFAAKTQATRSRSVQLSAYSAVSTKHYTEYLGRLEADDYAWAQQYQFPTMPEGFLKRVGKANELSERSRIRQQPIREMLVPLFPLLRQLVLLRKQLAERMLQAYRQAKRQAEDGGTTLPLAFQQVDSLPLLTSQGGNWELGKRELSVRYILWNGRSWILEHQERYSKALVREAEDARGVYSPDRDQYFVECAGASEDLLWFGELVSQRLLLYLHGESNRDPSYTARAQLARALGFSRGCYTSRSGLLQDDARWFAKHTRSGDLLFEPEATYRGVLYAAALATLAMTTGGSVSELLQVSADRWRNTREGLAHVLLPEGAKTEQERRPFKISPEALPLLEEIARGLEETYGEIPVVQASHQLTNFSHLQPERFLFQWQRSMVDPHDTQVLVRFLLYGIDLPTSNGEALRFSMEQLRYGGNVSLEERAQALVNVFGFNQTILPHLSSASSAVYCRDFFSYLEFAGSKEVALQPLTLARWIVHLGKMHYKQSTINPMVSVVQHIFTAAGEQGFIDQRIAVAFRGIEKIHAEKSAASSREDSAPHITFSDQFRTCGKPRCSVCQDGNGHGPYWYAFWSENGKHRSVYVGPVKNERTMAEALQKIEQLRGEKARPPAQLTRKAQQDMLPPLVPALCELIVRRKQLAERILLAFRQAQQDLVRERASMPFRFQHADTIPLLVFDPQSNAGGTLEERVVILSFSLWDKRSWVLHHQDRYTPENIRLAKRGINAYSNERNTLFVQFHGPPKDLLWVGVLAEQNLLRLLEPEEARDEESMQRIQLARDLGFPRGCHTGRAGLLDPGDRWFAENARVGELVVEPEALYRGVLYGAALALLTLSSGWAAGELLQASADGWVAQGGAIQALLPVMHESGAQDQRLPQAVILPAKQLLDEIADGLVQVHGGIPVVPPYHQHKQRLSPARYLFQWQKALIGPHDIQVLLRFILYGGLGTADGERLAISAELLRTSAAAHAAQQNGTTGTQQHDGELRRLRDALVAPLAPGLQPQTLEQYQSDLHAYLQFAGSAARAYQPETLKQWIAFLSRQPYDRITINRKITPIRRSMAEAGRQGQLDQQRALEFGQIGVGRAKKRGQALKVNAAVRWWLIDLWRATPGGLTVVELQRAYSSAFGEEVSATTLSKVLAQLRLRTPRPGGLTQADRLWIAQCCRQDPGITARELQEQVQAELGKTASTTTLNEIRASFGLQRPKGSPPRVVPKRPASYKLEAEDIAWLLSQRAANPQLSGPQLQIALRKQCGKVIGAHAIRAILRKHGLPTGRRKRSQQSSNYRAAQSVPISTPPQQTDGGHSQQEEPPYPADTQAQSALPGHHHSAMPGPSQPKPRKRQRRDHRRSRFSRVRSQIQPIAISTTLNPAAMKWLVDQCNRDPAIPNQELQTELARFGISITLQELSTIRTELGVTPNRV